MRDNRQTSAERMLAEHMKSEPRVELLAEAGALEMRSVSTPTSWDVLHGRGNWDTRYEIRYTYDDSVVLRTVDRDQAFALFTSFVLNPELYR